VWIVSVGTLQFVTIHRDARTLRHHGTCPEGAKTGSNSFTAPNPETSH
jgi:hypothetical protein